MAHTHKFCVAPMMNWTDRHCRYFHRQLSACALLYTEMVTADAVLFGNRERLLGFTAAEQPLALQLGGSDPAKLAEAAAIGEALGYDEINLNVGCPSDRVQEGRFGACLMAEPRLVAACVHAMRARVSVPVTVKCRIGFDDQNSASDLANFVDVVSDGGCEIFAIHARKAWLKGLSPKENRSIPPLDYARVYRLKQSRPDHTIIINGGLETLEACEGHLMHVDGVMVGRAAYRRPFMLADVDRRFFGRIDPAPSRESVLMRMRNYLFEHHQRGGQLHSVTRHLLGLYHGQRNGKVFRRYLSQATQQPEAGAEVLDEALDVVTNTMHRSSEAIA